MKQSARSSMCPIYGFLALGKEAKLDSKFDDDQLWGGEGKGNIRESKNLIFFISQKLINQLPYRINAIKWSSGFQTVLCEVPGKSLGGYFYPGLWARQQLQSVIAVSGVVGRHGLRFQSQLGHLQQSDFGQVILHLCTSVCSYVKWKLHFTLIRLLSGWNE